MKKNINIQKKLINHLIKNGKKKTSETILLKSLKKLQKNSFKKSKKIFQLALIHLTPIFKLHKISNKKLKKRTKKIREIPAFISNKQSRTSLAIKFILRNIKKKENLKFYQKLKKEILLNAINKNNTIQIKNELQKHILTKKRYFLFYRWN
jgi:ribosomal protein S7